MSQFRDAYGEFRRQNVEVATMSIDSPYCHNVWAEDLGVSYPMLSDANREIMAAYGIPPRASDLIQNVHTRSAFLIDSSRTVRYAWYGIDVGGLPRIPEILGAVRTLP